MNSYKRTHNQFSRTALALTALGIGTQASAVNLSWTETSSAVTGYTVYYGLGPIASDCSGSTGSFSAGMATSVTVPPNLFTANTPYYFAVSALNGTAQSTCSNSSPATPNPQGAQPAGSWIDTRVAMTVPGVSPAQVYLFSVNTLGGVSPVTQQSTGGYTPYDYSTQEDATGRLSIYKASANSVMVYELGVANNIARQSSSITNTTDMGNPSGDTRAYSAEKSFAFRAYVTPLGNVSLQKLDVQDFSQVTVTGLNTYPSAGANSVTTNGVTTAKVAQEIRSDANGVVILSLAYQGGVNNAALGLWTFPASTWSAAASINDSTVPGYIAQAYLPAKQDANGLYNYVGMGISGGTSPALNIAYAQKTSAQTKVIVDHYAGVSYPGSFPAATTGQSPTISCSMTYAYPSGTSVVRFDVQGDQLGRIWTQSAAGNLSYTLTDTANCNASAGTYGLTRPAGVPSNAVLIANGL